MGRLACKFSRGSPPATAHQNGPTMNRRHRAEKRAGSFLNYVEVGGRRMAGQEVAKSGAKRWSCSGCCSTIGSGTGTHKSISESVESIINTREVGNHQPETKTNLLLLTRPSPWCRRGGSAKLHQLLKKDIRITKFSVQLLLGQRPDQVRRWPSIFGHKWWA